MLEIEQDRQRREEEETRSTQPTWGEIQERQYPPQSGTCNLNYATETRTHS
jgi:hypothetical protein